jgi:hypothetical protein
MTLSENDHMIQAFTADRSDYPFRISVLPR